MRIRCPACKSEFSLEAAIESEAGSEFIGVIVNLPRDLQRPLIAYLGLFRAEKRLLSWDRTLRLARETLSLEADHDRLSAALANTVESIRRKRDQGSFKPFTNHNYLKTILADTPSGQALAPIQREPKQPTRPLTATERGLLALRGE